MARVAKSTIVYFICVFFINSVYTSPKHAAGSSKGKKLYQEDEDGNNTKAAMNYETPEDMFENSPVIDEDINFSKMDKYFDEIKKLSILLGISERDVQKEVPNLLRFSGFNNIFDVPLRNIFPIEMIDTKSLLKGRFFGFIYDSEKASGFAYFEKVLKYFKKKIAGFELGKRTLVDWELDGNGLATSERTEITFKDGVNKILLTFKLDSELLGRLVVYFVLSGDSGKFDQPSYSVESFPTTSKMYGLRF